jgi:anti-sigma factor RsiW
MRCEENVQLLIEAAALGEAPERSVAEHIQRCQQCRARFQREERLFAAIDNALHTRLSEPPRSVFLARASARLSKESTTNSSMNPTWGAAAVLVLALLALTRPWITSQQAIVAVTSAVPAARVQQNTSSATSVWDSSKESVVARPRKSSNSRSELSSVATQEPEVLVPPDEQKAFAQFVARVAGQDAMAAAVVSQAPNKTVPRNTALPQVSSVDVAQLERVDRDDSDEIDGSE